MALKLTEEQEAAREIYLHDRYAERSKRKGDYWWKKANAISGQGDYIPGFDDGEEPLSKGGDPNYKPQDGWELTAQIF